jgi:hypothetical protein
LYIRHRFVTRGLQQKTIEEHVSRFPRAHPAIPFMLLLAIADDALGLIVLAIFYTSGSLSLVPLGAGLCPPGHLLNRILNL